jgi:hypothetical protein
VGQHTHKRCKTAGADRGDFLTSLPHALLLLLLSNASARAAVRPVSVQSLSRHCCVPASMYWFPLLEIFLAFPLVVPSIFFFFVFCLLWHMSGPYTCVWRATDVAFLCITAAVLWMCYIRIYIRACVRVCAGDVRKK